jgi:predicted metal-dependent HD superfamily phosphohydrolase
MTPVPSGWHSGPMHALERRWLADCTAAAPQAPPRDVADVGRDLLRRWGEAHRRYHGTTHLAEVLAAVDLLCAAEQVSADDRVVAGLAAWFHDAVYVVEPAATAAENESQSAALADRVLGTLGVDATTRARVTASVLDTGDHGLSAAAATDRARVVLHDADLWVLAAPVGRFDEYCTQVRAEYAHVPVATYARERSGVLRPFLVRDHVYRTAHARTAWEPAARENLARELTRLAG